MSPPDAFPPVGVLFVLTDLRVGGQERALVRVLERIDRARIRPVVACLKQAGALGPSIQDLDVPLYSELIAGRLDLRVLWRLRGVIRREGIRVVCTIGCGDKMFWGRLAAWLSGVPGIVSTIHKTRNPDGSPVIERSNRLLTPLTHRFVAVGRGAAEYLVAEEGLPKNRVMVIYNGVDVKEYGNVTRADARRRLGIEDDALVIVQVAVLRPEKHHASTLEAMAQILPRVPKLRLELIGDGPERVALEAQVAKLGLIDHVHFRGERDDVPELLSASDVFVLSSRPRVETLSNAVLEAMASRLPVVCTRVGSLNELIDDGKTGFLVEPEDSSALAEALYLLLKDRELRESMGTAGRERVATYFTLKQMVEAREQLFMELAR